MTDEQIAIYAHARVAFARSPNARISTWICELGRVAVHVIERRGGKTYNVMRLIEPTTSIPEILVHDLARRWYGDLIVDSVKGATDAFRRLGRALRGDGAALPWPDR